jgi:hypothetical protein
LRPSAGNTSKITAIIAASRCLKESYRSRIMRGQAFFEVHEVRARHGVLQPIT